jgi:hypothetical protein
MNGTSHTTVAGGNPIMVDLKECPACSYPEMYTYYLQDFYRASGEDKTVFCYRCPSCDFVISAGHIDQMEKKRPWILCSEQLPTDQRRYEVTIRDDCGRNVYTDNFSLRGYVAGWVYWGHNVIAWREVSAPYEGPE